MDKLLIAIVIGGSFYAGYNMDTVIDTASKLVEAVEYSPERAALSCMENQSLATIRAGACSKHFERWIAEDPEAGVKYVQWAANKMFGH